MNRLKELWVERMTEAMSYNYPDISNNKLKKMVEKIYDDNVKDTSCQIYNSYENSIANLSLLTVVDWINLKKPLIAESGVFFIPKNEKRNVNVEIIKECMLDARKIHKKEKFKALEAGEVFLAAVKDIQQANDKKAANSGYGAEGQASSFLYNLNSAMSVTASGRGQLSTACQCFENLLADNVKFFNMNEFYNWVYNIVHESDNWVYNIMKIIPVIPSEDEFIERYRNKFGMEEAFNEEAIRMVYQNLEDELKLRVYYKANLKEFMQWNYPSVLISDIAYSDIEFIDPNEIPDGLIEPVNELVNMIVEIVGYKHSVFRYEDRTKYQPRAVTPVMDTDSNFIYLGATVDFLENEILPKRLFKMSKEERTGMELRIINTLAVLTTRAVTQTLFNYLGYVNVAIEDRPHINMKNEFHYSTVITTFAKKSYVGLQLRQEGVVFKEPVLDVKGVNFFKSTASQETSDFIYKEILMKQLLQPESGTPSLKDTYKAIYKFQKKITKEIAEGNMGYLKRSIKVKTPDGYANPMRIGQFKAVYIWNKIVPDEERIVLPATVTIVKVKLKTMQDAGVLAEWPNIYNRVMHLFENDPEVGDYEEDGKIKKGKGINTIALPETLDYVPDWVLSIIDVETLVEDNMKLFSQIYASLGLSVGNTSANRKYYTSVIRL